MKYYELDFFVIMLKKIFLISLLTFLSGTYISCSKYPALSVEIKNEVISTASVDDYRFFLDMQNQSELNSISKGLIYYKKMLTKLTQPEKDAAFINFREFYSNVINKYNSEFYNNTRLRKKLELTNSEKDNEVNTFKKKLLKNGLVLLHSEGSYYVDEDPNFLLNNFYMHVSVSFKEYLGIRKKELNQGFTEDGGLTIPFKKLGERIHIWEEFISKYPVSPLIEDAKQNYDLYLRTFMNGIDNTPVFDPKSRILRPDVKRAYIIYTEKYSNKESGKLIKKYYNLLAKHKFKRTPEIDTFLKNHLI